MNLIFADNVKRARKGDADAFAELYALVYKDLYRIALANLRNNSHDAADVVSDTVLDAFSSVKNLKDEQAFKAWIVKILIAKIKKKQKDYINNNTQDIDDVEQETTDGRFNGIEIMEEIARLDETERLVLSLSIVSGYSSDEVAKITGINSATVRSKLSRAKVKLKSRLS